MKRIWLAAAAACAFTLLLSGVAGATVSKTKLDIIGFTKDYKRMLVRIDDVNYGLGLRMYDTESGKPLKRSRVIEFERSEEVRKTKWAKRRYKIKDEGVESMKTEDEKIAFFAVEKGENLVIACTDYKRLGKITDIPLKKDEQTEKLAQGRLKTIFWSSDRKVMILVVTQKMKGQVVYEKDTLHYIPFKKDRILWVEPEKSKKEKEKEKEEEDDGWWPFW